MTVHKREDKHRNGTTVACKERPCLQLLQQSKAMWELRVVARQYQLLQAVSRT